MIFFFFSSRRRHTIYWRDWSSDVCSSDLGQRHNLPLITAMNLDGTMNEEAKDLAGLDRFEARAELVKIFEGDGTLVKTEPHELVIGRCDRCDTIVEPLVSTQWFVDRKSTRLNSSHANISYA